MADEKILANIILKSRSGLSIFNNFDQFTFSRLDEFRPKSNNVDQVVNQLIQAGFEIEAQTNVGISFSGSKELYESEFGVSVQKREVRLEGRGIEPQQVSFFKASQPISAERARSL